ncbi:MAG: fused MFS/spermidine synthase [Candidatus Sumerlaeota bacterium]|nr:fused MFS/spermidine synthase [Candidatus Sumerlaeota bacterium]
MIEKDKEPLSDKPSLPAARLAIVAGLFFITGATGLIYEVLWTRQLINIFGATIYAVSTVLAAFMGGLALGSWLFGRAADSWRNPFRLYGFLEILIGVAAFCLPYMIGGLDPLFQAMYDRLQANFLLFSLIRFCLIFALLLIPTTIMGATLPVLSRYLARQKETIGARIGLLYSLNTFGAVAGCFLSGFILIEQMGLSQTKTLAVCFNIAVGLTAIALSGILEKDNKDSRDPKDPNKESPASSTQSTSSTMSTTNNQPPLPSPLSPLSSPYPSWVPRAVLWSYAVSGGVALAYQVLWSRALVFAMDVMKNTTYAFTAMLTVFLIGLALGGAIMARFVDRERDPLRLYGLIQILIGLGGALSLYVILYVARGMEIIPYANLESGRVMWKNAVINIFFQSFAGIFLPTLLMGMAFPVAARLYVGDVRRVGGQLGRLYAMNTLGAIVGSFLGGFVIIPLIGLGPGIMTLALLNVAMGAALIIWNPRADEKARRVWMVASLIIIALVLTRFPSSSLPFQEIAPHEKMISYREGALATVSVIENEVTRHRTIYVDNVGVAGTDPILLTDQKSLAHFPTLFLPDPQSALTVGFGSGGASHSYCLYDFMKRVDCVEICDTVLKAAPDLTSSNHGIIRYASPDRKGQYIIREDARGRYGIILDDARSYLRFTRERYDIIATDCTDLKYKSNANLYDREYFQLCADHITSGGMVVVWMPLGGLSDETFRLCLRTFYRVFPEHFSVWYMNNEPTHYILLIGTRQPLAIDVDKIAKRLSDPKIANDLAEVGLADPYKLLSCYIADQRQMDAFLAGDRLNTENTPYVEFEAPRYGIGDKPLLDNLNRLWKHRNDITPYLKNWAGARDPKQADLLKRYCEAAGAILEGHCAYRNLEIEEAARCYLRARAICPEDKSISRMLEFRELYFRIQNMPQDLWGLTKMGRVLLMTGRYDEALDMLRRANTLAGAQQSAAAKGAPLDTLTRKLILEAWQSLTECENKLATPKTGK